MLLCGSFALHLRAADRGCEVSTRPSLRPLGLRGWSDEATLGRNEPRGREGMSASQDAVWSVTMPSSYSVIASAAKQSRVFPRRDSGLLRRAAALAMTTWRELRSMSALSHLLAISHHLRHHGLPRARRELPAPGHDHHCGSGHEQQPRAHEPAEIAECEEEGALAAVEVTAGGFEHAGGADDVGFGLPRIAPGGRRPAGGRRRAKG